MTQTCCNSFCSWCCCLPSTSNGRTKPRTKHILLKRLHVCGLLAAQILATAILIAVALWLIVRPQEPAVYVTGMELEAINSNLNKPNSTLLHYNLTIKNPDLYKYVHYDALMFHINYSGYNNKWGIMVNFGNGGGFSQRPRKVTLLGNHTSDYSVPEAKWLYNDMVKLKTVKKSIHLRCVMVVRYRAFKIDVASRQYMKVADVYFDDDGKSLISDKWGLRLK